MKWIALIALGLTLSLSACATTEPAMPSQEERSATINNFAVADELQDVQDNLLAPYRGR